MIFKKAFGAALAVASIFSAALAVPLEPRAAPALPSYLNKRSTFYRAVHHGEELKNVKSIYPVGQSPKPRVGGTPLPGDLGPGALYVYAVSEFKYYPKYKVSKAYLALG